MAKAINMERSARISRAKRPDEGEADPIPYKPDREVVAATRKTRVVNFFNKKRLEMSWILTLSCGHTICMNVTLGSPYYENQPKKRGCYLCKQEEK
jgi:hypothetical protein